MIPEEVLFPHSTIRKEQDKLISAINQTIEQGGRLIAHAPTGLGKTAASISPCLSYALKKDKVIFFLTGRHTQHKIALNTLSAIKDKYKLTFCTADIIAKKWFCLQPNVRKLKSQDFNEYCKKLKEDTLCEYYSNLRQKEALSKPAIALLKELKQSGTITVVDAINASSRMKICPYEVTLLHAKEARVIITDYSSIFNPSIREGLFRRLGRELDDCILIIDEAHNLPARMKELMSERLSTITINRAISEARKLGNTTVIGTIQMLGNILINYTKDCTETYVTRDDFMKKIPDYDGIIDTMEILGKEVLIRHNHSSLSTIASFLRIWPGTDNGYTRIASRKKTGREDIITLAYQCLDPSTVTADVLNNCHSAILMSGTLTPTSMYRELLGVNSGEIMLKSPFPKKNRLNLIIPQTTTKYQTRSIEEYKRIGTILTKSIDAIPGNAAVFFPSYALRDEIAKHVITKKTVFTEEADLSKTDKDDMLERFKNYKATGAVLLAVISGNFGEGIDLPGDELKGVIIVGLPLSRPDLETKALIEYYDKKFNKGWEYGYINPAFTKTLQSAGRCIRSETDRGVIIFLDERYAWKNYFNLFPTDWDMRISDDYSTIIRDFFKII